MTRLHQLVRDENGAMMVAGTFMAVFLVAVLYHVVGVGRSIVTRERLQDSADAAAFESALGYARSMNEIALANNIQMIAVANLWALEEAKTNIDACDAAAQYYGYPQILCPPLVAPVHRAHDESTPPLQDLVRRTRDVGEGLREATPALERGRLQSRVLTQPGSDRALVAAGLVDAPMPLRTAGSDVLCERADPYVRPLMNESILPRDVVDSFVLPAMELMRPSPECPLMLGPLPGPQVMSPANQSGTEELQLRAIVVGADPTTTTALRERGVGLARMIFGHQEPLLTPTDRRSLGRVGLAQAEYFSAWEHAMTVQNDTRGFPGVMPEENTFYMHWRARLRRLRVPVDVEVGSGDAEFASFVQGPLVSACQDACVRGTGGSEVCGALPLLGRVGNNALQ